MWNETDGVGEVLAKAFYDYFNNAENARQFKELLCELVLEQETVDTSNDRINGKVFVVTGSLQHFDNRDALKELIEGLGGKVTGSVTSKTTALINNDITSTSSKNKKARELGIPVITEKEFLSLAGK